MKFIVRLSIPMLIVLLSSCSKNAPDADRNMAPETMEGLNEGIVQSPRIITQITLKDLESELGASTNYKNISERFDVNVAQGIFAKNGGDDYVLDTGHINKMDSGGYVSYTMKVQDSKVLQNVVIEPSADSLRLKLYSYAFLDKLKVDGEGFTLGSMNVISLDEEQVSTNTAMSGCYMTTVAIPHPCGGTPSANQPERHMPGESCGDAQQPGYIWINTSICPSGGSSPGFGAPLFMPRECTALQCSPIMGSGGGGGGSTGTPGGGGGFGGGSIPIIDDQGNSLFDIYLQASISYLEEHLGPLGYADEYYLKSHSVNMQKVMDFLYLNGESAVAAAFSKEAIKALKAGREVDFEDRVINTITFPCPADVVENANKTDNPIGQKIKDAFGNQNTPDLFYSNEDIPQDNPDGRVLGRTIPTTDSQGNITRVKIELDNDFLLEATDISIFATVIHENIHALMYYQLSNAGINIDDANIDYSALANEWTKYVAHLQAGVPQDQILTDLEIMQHQIMGDIVAESAQIIQNYGNSKGYGVSENTAEALAWAGLHTSVAWTLLNETVKQNYRNIIDDESTGFEILAIGSPCY